MGISFRPVTRANFTTVIELKVMPEQADFVASNLYSLAEAAIEPHWTPLAIYAGEDLVGFALFGRDDETGRWWLMRYMIDAQHQGRGYGTAALPVLIDLMIERHGCIEIFLDYSPSNDVAERRGGGRRDRGPARTRKLTLKRRSERSRSWWPGAARCSTSVLPRP